MKIGLNQIMACSWLATSSGLLVVGEQLWCTNGWQPDFEPTQDKKCITTGHELKDSYFVKFDSDKKLI